MKLFFYKNLRKVTIFAWFLKILAIPFNLLLANMTANLIADAIAGEVEIAIRLSVLIFTFVLGYKIISMMMNICYEKMVETVQHKCKMKLYEYYLDHSISKLYTFRQGELLEKLNDDFKVVVGKYTTLFPALGADLLTAVVYVFFLAKEDWLLATILFFMALVQMMPPLIVKRFLQQNYEDCRDIEAKLTNLTLEGYRGFLEIKMYRLKEWYLNRVEVIHQDYLKIGTASCGSGAIQQSMETFIEYLLKYGATIVAGALVLYGRITLQAGLSAIVLSGSFFAAVKSVFSTIPNFAVAKKAQDRIEEWEHTRDTQKSHFENHEIQLKNVTFLQGEKMIFREVTYTFHENGVTVIKGENGIGKSTLLKLITGLVECQNGVVTIGENDARTLSEDCFPTTIFYLPQERIQMDLSVAELIELMNPDRKAFRVMEEIFGVDKKWKENRLETLSGGEEKRLLLALAFAVNPEILILDEPTNSLDMEGRSILCKMIGDRKKGTLIVTHENIFDPVADYQCIVKEGGICDGKEV